MTNNLYKLTNARVYYKHILIQYVLLYKLAFIHQKFPKNKTYCRNIAYSGDCHQRRPTHYSFPFTAPVTPSHSFIRALNSYITRGLVVVNSTLGMLPGACSFRHLLSLSVLMYLRAWPLTSRDCPCMHYSFSSLSVVLVLFFSLCSPSLQATSLSSASKTTRNLLATSMSRLGPRITLHIVNLHLSSSMTVRAQQYFDRRYFVIVINCCEILDC